MEICERYVGSWITPGVTFVDSICIVWPTEAKHQELPAYLTITMMTFLFGICRCRSFKNQK